jgi:hypothetical protein
MNRGENHMTRIKIEIERFGDRGTRWTIDGTQYRTDKSGHGIWKYRKSRDMNGNTNTEIVQTTGTAQFSLPANDGTPEAVRKIRRRLRQEFVDDRDDAGWRAFIS